jgi:hypothetical protein
MRCTAVRSVLRLVDCSLLVPPATGPDGRSRYLMLQTLRDYGLSQLRKAGEEHDAAAVLAVHALDVAEQAATQMAVRSGEKPAVLWLDAEDAAVTRGWPGPWTTIRRPRSGSPSRWRSGGWCGAGGSRASPFCSVP